MQIIPDADMPFKGVQKTLTFKQTNTGSQEEVFPLLCPVREADWLDGWSYTMIHSTSGLIEQDCVFSTPHHGTLETIWYVTHYDKTSFEIEFLRVTPGENVVKINIRLLPIDSRTTLIEINYQYTGLNEDQNKFIEDDLEKNFEQSMTWWEKAINHYLVTGKKLMKH
jgi:hypothetical protein